MSIKQQLSQRIQAAMAACDIPAECGANITRSTKPEFGDFQANGVLAAAKRLKTNPRELAQRVLDGLDISDIASKVELAGPGFINIHLSDEFLGNQLNALSGDDRLGIAEQTPQTVVVDYSAPNLAKEMHVGHLRSTIIGDAVVRALEFLGHKVIRQNHMGDWGTQFGMLIAELEEQLGEGEQAELALKDLESFYQQSKKHFDDDEAFAQKARDYVVKLQSGDAHCLALWQQFIDISVQHSEEIYRALNVTLSHDHIKPESAYNDALAGVIETLEEKGLAVDDDGAKVVFLEELADKNGNPSPMIVQKSGGGYLYATTDLAALDYRCNQLNADRILLFIDARQSLHMKQVITAGRKAGFASEQVSFEHHPFGTMMGADGKPFKTRSGGTVKLADLLVEAVERADKLVVEKNPDMLAELREEVARKVGIGAVKYADLSKTRTNDYIFSWDSMLSFEGNTAPYLQYAYARINSIFRKAGINAETLSGAIGINAPQEKALALKLLQFGEAVEQVAVEAYPHVLCNYLYELASQYMSFYEHCPVLRSDVDEATRNSRLLLCKQTATTLAKGLDLLGIEVMEQM
ncbi:arginine--tRNA ligase [Porticoccus sp. W117]|uniref:arginine--tRNA ligase n=1 Tax=Porticoccus sp. W117 TaxID=3054777 RepID=UPI002594137D|nr:arginine--tRNA ligase [Porticoccus sp. W117]MDM3869805.1 arginine--tRNA ligase [Porticoccus sp. W117]